MNIRKNISNINQNLDLFFNYNTLINDPEIKNTTLADGEYDYENANYGFEYYFRDANKIVESFKFERTDNDNEIFYYTGINQGEEKLNKFIFKTRIGEFGFVEGDIVNLLDGSNDEVNYFFYKVDFQKNYYLGKNFNIKGKTSVLLSDYNTNVNLSLDMSKVMGIFKSCDNHLGFGNILSYSYNFNPKKDIDIKGELKNNLYSEIYLNGINSKVEFGVLDLKFKDSGININTPLNFDINIAKFVDKETPLNCNYKLGWN